MAAGAGVVGLGFDGVDGYVVADGFDGYVGYVDVDGYVVVVDCDGYSAVGYVGDVVVVVGYSVVGYVVVVGYSVVGYEGCATGGG